MKHYQVRRTPDGALPPLGGSDALHGASEAELRVLLSLLSGTPDDTAALAAAADCSPARAAAALHYWLAAGVLEEGDAAPAEFSAPAPTEAAGTPRTPADVPGIPADQPAEADAGIPVTLPAKPPLRPVVTGLSERSADEIAARIRENPDRRAFIETCEQTVGRIFNQKELGILTSLLDDYPFSPAYLLTLISYCKKKTKKFSFLYLEKTAASMLERECLSEEQLAAYLAAEERFSREEWQLRRLLGIGERPLSSGERTYLHRWAGEFGYGADVIGIAYDIAVNYTGKVSLQYMNKLLTGWNGAGCRTPAEVDARLAREREEHLAAAQSGAASPARPAYPRPCPGAKSAPAFSTTVGEHDRSATHGSSFSGEDYMSAALRRSYGDSGDEE